jgi:hypothetical protein
MPADFTVIVNRSKLNGLMVRSSAARVVRTTEKAAMVARALAPGSMKEHIRAIPSAGLGIVMSDHPATTFVIYKTKPHEIKAKRPGGRLKFKINGKTIYRRKVWHPGNQHPNNFLLKALEAAKF